MSREAEPLTDIVMDDNDTEIGALPPRDRELAILRAVEKLHADAAITDATCATLAARYDDRRLIELPVVIGQYQASPTTRTRCACASTTTIRDRVRADPPPIVTPD